MKREFLQRFTMLVLLTLVLATAAVSANAQSTANRVVANVPFEFSVGYKTLPAGEYSVEAILSAGNGLLIKSSDGKISALRLSDSTRQIKEQSQARMVFHRYGERYFLAEVWNGVDQTGRRLTESQEERALESGLLASARENAHPAATYEIVEVLALLR